MTGATRSGPTSPDAGGSDLGETTSSDGGHAGLGLWSLYRWGPLAIVAVVALAPFFGLWRAPGPPMEEGFMLVFPELVLKGMVPNKDFLHLYGPGSLWVLGGAYEIFGTTLETERMVGYLQHLGVVFGVFALAKHWGRWLAAGSASLAAVVIIPPIGLTALAWTGGIAFATWTVVAGTSALDAEAGSRRRNWLLIGAGLLGGAALLYRPDLFLAVTLPALVVFLGLDKAGRIRLVAAAAVGVSPYLIHVAMAGFGDSFHGMFWEPVFDLRDGRRLPLPPSWNEFDGFLQLAGQLIEPAWHLPSPPSPAQLSIWLGILIVGNVALVVLGVMAFRRDGSRRLLAMALLAAALMPQALQRADSTHLAWASCLTIGFLPVALAEVFDLRWPSMHAVWRTVAAIGAVVLVMLFLIPRFTFQQYLDVVNQGFGDKRVVYTMQRGDRVFYYGREDAAAAVMAMIPDVEALMEDGQLLFVGTGDLRKTPLSEAYLYYLFPELDPATRYIEMDPGIANAPDSGLADELANADIVILSSIRDDWVEPNASRDFGPNEPNEVLERDFCLVGSYGEGLFGRGLFELWIRC